MKKIFTAIILFSLASMLLLSGCSANKDEDNEKNPNTGTEETDGSNAEEGQLKPYYEYADVLYDRSIVEGKFACYFIHCDASMNTYESETVSGDSVLLIAPDGTTMLIDCNMISCGSHIVSVLQRLGVTKLDYFVNTHPHGDHVGGWDTLLRYIDIEQVYINGSKIYQNTGNRYVTGFLAALDEKGIPYEALYQGDTLEFGGVQIDVLWPGTDTDWAKETTDLLQNDNSIVMRATYKKASFLFGGDIGIATETALIATYGDELKTDIVKMNHHGYTYSSESDNWVNTVSSKLAVATYYSAHPEETMYRYIAKGSIPLYGGIDKGVLVYTDGDGTYDVQVEKDREFFDYLLPDMTDGHFTIE